MASIQESTDIRIKEKRRKKMTRAYPTKPIKKFTIQGQTFIKNTKMGFKKAKILELKEHAKHRIKVVKTLNKINSKEKPYALGHAFIWNIDYLNYKYVVGYACSHNLEGIISKLKEKFPNDNFWYNLD